MNAAPTRPGRKIVALAIFRGLLVFVPISAMKFMPDSDWFWDSLLVAFLFLFTSELVLSFRWFQGWRCVAAVTGSVGFTVIGLPLIACAAFIISLVIGTFVFPPR